MASAIRIKNYKASLSENYVLVLTANSVERDAINGVLTRKHRADVGLDTLGVTLGFLKENFVLHVAGESGVSLPKSIGRIAVRLLGDASLPKPSLIVLAGFCWGNPARVKRGDVIVCDSIFSVNRTAAAPSGMISNGLAITSKVAVSNRGQDVTSILRAAGITSHCGPLASAEILYSNEQLRDQLLQRYPELLGGEMEAFGFLDASIPWLVIKAVSDMADETFDRTHQVSAASAAASALCELSGCFDYLNLGVSSKVIDASQECLLSILTGETIELHARDLISDSLSDQVNDELGPSVESSLHRYLGAREGRYDREVVEVVLALLLEVAQNALSHGRASKVSIKFHDTKIVYSDDGLAFDPRSIEVGSGGAIAVREFMKLTPELADLEIASERGNCYTIKLMKMAESIDKVRRDCSLSVVPGQVSRTMAGGNVFTFDRECTTVYLDAGQVFSVSRRIQLARELRPILQEGRRVIVGCRGANDRRHFVEELGSLADQVTFVDAVPLQGSRLR